MNARQPSQWVTTSAVLERLGALGDHEAWQQFVERFRAPIERFARRRGLGADDAEDAAQETLLAFARGYSQGQYDRSKGRLSSWLFGIAWRRIDQTRRRLARPEEPLESGASSFWAGVPAERSTSAEWDEVWERCMIEQCVRQLKPDLSPATFRVFEMLVLEQRSVAEVMQELDLSRNAVYIARHRAMVRMRELLGECEDSPEVP